MFLLFDNQKSINKLVKGKVIKETQLSLFDEHYIVNGFDHPRMPVITNEKPNEIQHFQWGFLPSSVYNAQEFLSKYNSRLFPEKIIIVTYNRFLLELDGIHSRTI